MEEHELTIRINISFEETLDKLKEQGVIFAEEFTINDIYMTPKEFSDIEKYDSKRLLEMSVRVRSTEYIIKNSNLTELKKQIVKKDKVYDNDNIVGETIVKCTIKDEKEAYELLKALGYVTLIELKQKAIEFSKDNVSFVVSEINNRVYIELEDKDRDGNTIFHTIKDMKERLHNLNLPFSEGEYFVQKAVDEIRFLRDKNRNK